MIDWPKKALFPLLYCRLYVLYCTAIERNESIHISWNSSAILLQLLLPIWPFLQFRGKISALQCYHFYSKVNLWQGAGTGSYRSHTYEILGWMIWGFPNLNTFNLNESSSVIAVQIERMGSIKFDQVLIRRRYLQMEFVFRVGLLMIMSYDAKKTWKWTL